MIRDQDLSNGEIIGSVLAGSTDCFEVLIRRYTAKMLRYASAILRDSRRAEEAVEEAFVDCYLHLSSLKNPDAFEGWLAKTVKRKCFRLCAQPSWEELSEYGELLCSEERTPEEYVIFSEQRQRVRQTVDALPEKMRLVTLLYYFEGQSIPDIARKLQIPEGSVKRRLFDAREKLRKELSDMNEPMQTKKIEESILKKIAAIELYYALGQKSSAGKELATLDGLVGQLSEEEKKRYYHAELLRIKMKGLDSKSQDYKDTQARLQDAAGRGEHPETLAVKFLDEAFDKFDMGDNLNAKRATFLRETALPEIERCKASPGYGAGKAILMEWIGSFLARSDEGDLEGAVACYKEGRAAAPDGSYYAIALDHLIEVCENALQNAAFPEMGVSAVTVRLCTEDRRCVVTGQSGSLRELPVRNRQSAYLLTDAVDRNDALFDETVARGDATGSVACTASEEEQVCVAAGTFDHCHRVVTCAYEGADVQEVWYKEGVGPVKMVLTDYQGSITYELADYEICGGTGLFPQAVGNRWSFSRTAAADDSGMQCYLRCKVIGLEEDGKTSYLAEESFCNIPKNCADLPGVGNTDVYLSVCRRLCQKWKLEEALSYMRAALRANNSRDLADLALYGSESLERYVSYQKQGYRFLPGHIGVRHLQKEADGSVIDLYDDFQLGLSRYGWRGKYEDRIFGAKPMRYQEIFTGKLFDGSWKPGYHAEVPLYYRDDAKDDFVEHTGTVDVSEGGLVETPAGCFDRCIKLTLELELEGKEEGYYLNWNDGYKYQSCGKKEYYYAPDVGLVKMVCTWGDYLRTELLLTEYRAPAMGTGEYFPLYVGNRWVYEETNLKNEGYRACTVLQVTNGIGDNFTLYSAQEFVFLGTEEEYKKKFFPHNG